MHLLQLIKKYKVVLFVALLVYVCSQFVNVREGLATTCGQFGSCKECVDGKVTDTSSPCYWNAKLKKCSAFEDDGYSRKCTDTSCPACEECPKLTLLKWPSYITKQ